VIRSFKRQSSEDIFNGINSKDVRRACPPSLCRITARKLDQLDSVVSIDELRIPPGNHLEVLIGDRSGQYSIHINDHYRICFSWKETGPVEVEVVDYRG